MQQRSTLSRLTGSFGPLLSLDQLPEPVLPSVPLLEGCDKFFMFGEAGVIVDG
jgi:hypothetical protein